MTCGISCSGQQSAKFVDYIINAVFLVLILILAAQIIVKNQSLNEITVILVRLHFLLLFNLLDFLIYKFFREFSKNFDDMIHFSVSLLESQIKYPRT